MVRAGPTVMHLRFGPFLSSSFTVLSWNRAVDLHLAAVPRAPAIFVIPVVVPARRLGDGFPRFCISFTFQVAVRTAAARGPRPR